MEDENTSITSFMKTEVFSEPVTSPRLDSYEPFEVAQAREQDRQGRRIKVLITVKATPQPSKKYVDTVCVAGLALNPLRWVRLYPIPFRYLDPQHQFKKYAIVDVKVSRANNDERIESLKVETNSITTVEELSTARGWADRVSYIEPIGELSLCAMQEAVKLDHNAPSLGMIRVKEGTFSLEMDSHGGWSPSQKENLRRYAEQQALQVDGLGIAKRLPEILEAPPLKIWTRFHCGDECSKLHRLRFIDWEATPLMRRELPKGQASMKSVILEKFQDNPGQAEKDLRIFVGNQSLVTRRQSFQALGLYYPAKATTREFRETPSPLF